MHDRCFVDTNIWFYSLVCGSDSEGQEKTAWANQLLDQLDRPVISAQVVQELSVNLLKKADYSEHKTRQAVEALYRDCQVVQADMGVFIKASELREHNGISYWDSLIVASALGAGCNTLFSEDMQHGQLFDGRLKVQNPFHESLRK